MRIHVFLLVCVGYNDDICSPFTTTVTIMASLHLGPQPAVGRVQLVLGKQPGEDGGDATRRAVRQARGQKGDPVPAGALPGAVAPYTAESAGLSAAECVSYGEYTL